MPDRDILKRFVNLDISALIETEKIFLDMLYIYKDTFSVRDEISICPNIEVDIEVIYTSPFLIRLFHVKEGTPFMDKEGKTTSFWEYFFCIFVNCYN